MRTRIYVHVYAHYYKMQVALILKFTVLGTITFTLILVKFSLNFVKFLFHSKCLTIVFKYLVWTLFN